MQNPVTYLYKYLKHLVDLKDGLDVEGTIYEIKNNRKMEGANAWMLMCSIVIASLGLDLNSPAVIIGAMLISPLMAPILGVGLGVGIADMDTIKTALQHFGIAIIIALLTSTLYFYFTPLGEFTEQIANRTQPTLLDVMVAFFGGIAGIVSSSRKDKTNAIPGVAIATALMPPLCVTGFGIATGNMEVLLNSFYLFFLNSFFVALATYIMVRWLDFPIVTSIDGKSRLRGLLIVGLLSLILIIPSVLILKNVYKTTNFNNKASTFINEYFSDRDVYIDSWAAQLGEPNQIILKVYGNDINFSDTTNCKPALKAAGLENTKIQIISTSEISPDEFSRLQSQVDGITTINERLEIIQQSKKIQDSKVDSLVNQIELLRSDSLLFSSVQKEVKILFPQLNYFAFGDATTTDFENPNEKKKMAIIEWSNGIRPKEKNESTRKLDAYLRQRINTKRLELIEK